MTEIVWVGIAHNVVLDRKELLVEIGGRDEVIIKIVQVQFLFFGRLLSHLQHFVCAFGEGID